MSNLIHSKELILNKKFIPDTLSEEYFDFWQAERDKCKNGIYIDGVYLSGFLYYHLNFFKCQLDILDNGRVIRKLANPYLRDNEWIIDEYIRKAEEQKKGLCILGSRRLAKSVYEASYITHRSTFYKGTQNVIAGLNEPDIKVITDLCEEALGGLPDAFRHGRIEDNWKKQVTFGKKSISGERTPWSSIPIRNLDGGKNTEALAGLSPFSMVIDEIGKGDWLAAFSAAIPGFATPFGWRCSPLAFGTSGDMQKAQDAKKVFEDPDVYNFLSVELKDDSTKKTSVFISGHYAHDFPKDDTPLNEYLQIPKEKAPNLANINIKVTNKDRADKMIDEERIQASQSNDMTALLKLTMYHPKNIDELFLTESNNKFPIEPAKQRQHWLKNHYEAQYIDLYRDITGKVTWKNSNKTPITKFPIRPSDDKDACLSVYEMPIENAPRFTYTIGIDPIHSDDSNDKVVSLCCMTVYKRMISPLDEFKNQVVATIAYRPKEIQETHEMALMLAEFYNAIEGIYHEASESSLVQYFFLKKKSQYIADSFDLNSEISKNRFKGSAKKGSPPSTVHQRHYMNLMIEDANKETIELTEEGDEVYKIGVQDHFDYMLLEEMVNYKGGTGRTVHDGNFDRIVSYGLALTLARHYDVKYPIAQFLNRKEESTEIYKPKSIRAFGMMIEKKQGGFLFEEKSKTNIPFWMRGKS